MRALESLANDETLLVQSGKPVGIFRTHPESPRVLLANSNLVGHWSNWDEFNRLEKLGLTMYGQMTAGSWIYIGSQGIVQGTYETFASLARKHFGGSLAGKLVVSGGMGGMGGAQPLAATMNGARFLGIEVDAARIQRRIDTGYCDRMARTLDEALAMLAGPEAISVGLVGNCADVLPEMARRGIVPDVLTDQTSAHDPLNGYVPNGMTLEDARLPARAPIPANTWRAAWPPWARMSKPCCNCSKAGAVTFDYGNNLRTQAKNAGVEHAFDIPGFVPEYIRPLFCEGRGPFRWVALSGDPADIYRTDRLAARNVPARRNARALAPAGASAHTVPGTARAHLLAGLRRARRIRPGHQRLVRSGELKAPIVIGRDHLDTGSVASPFRETEGMRDGSDAIADWPLLNALVNTAAGASWVSIHNGGGVGIGYSQHAGMVVVADGTDGNGSPPGARAHQRPRHGSGAPRRRRLSGSDTLRRNSRHQAAGGMSDTQPLPSRGPIGHRRIRAAARQSEPRP